MPELDDPPWTFSKVTGSVEPEATTGCTHAIGGVSRSTSGAAATLTQGGSGQVPQCTGGSGHVLARAGDDVVPKRTTFRRRTMSSTSAALKESLRISGKKSLLKSQSYLTIRTRPNVIAFRAASKSLSHALYMLESKRSWIMYLSASSRAWCHMAVVNSRRGLPSLPLSVSRLLWLSGSQRGLQHFPQSSLRHLSAAVSLHCLHFLF